MDNKTRLLFITRKYPPMVGGMEKFSFALSQELSKKTDLTLIKWGYSQKWLFLFLPYALIKALIIIPLKKIEHVHLADALLSPLGVVIKFFYNVQVSSNVHGLDVTFRLPIYQYIIPKCLQKLDKVVCISHQTLEECIKRGIPENKCIVIPPGVNPEEFQINASRSDLKKIINTEIADKKILVTVGRLIKRKGVYWFIENVFPKLDESWIYLVVGDGPDKNKIIKLIQDLKFQDRILMLGKISNNDLKVIYNTSDIFVMPNIKVEGDMEGFGMVATEASSTGLPVVASDLEGIKDAVIDNKTGIKVKNNDYTASILKALSNTKKEVQEEVRKNFDWTIIGNKYINQFNENNSYNIR
jgi:glycosyltransferase involved in cell wall biosynthesis